VEITKKQIEELNKCVHLSYVKMKLEEWFPSAFESEYKKAILADGIKFENGQWITSKYFDTGQWEIFDGGDWFFVVNKNESNVDCLGFQKNDDTWVSSTGEDGIGAKFLKWYKEQCSHSER
jgi:hypothetical protein